MSNNFPNVNPAASDSLTGFARELLTSWLRNEVSNCLPATVVKYNRTKNTATLAPSIKMVTTDGNLINRAPLVEVPVFNYGGGGFVINFPLQEGDTGWVKANDRDISLFLLNKKAAKPNTGRLWSFSDSVFYPDIIKGATISNTDSLVIQNLNGTIKIELSPTEILLKNASKQVKVTSAKTFITGDLEVSGNVKAADFEAGAYTFLTHTNSGNPMP